MLQSRQTLIAAYGQNDRAEQAVEVASSASSMQMKTVGTLMQAVGGRGDALEELAWRACPSPIVRSCGMGLRGLFLGRAQRGDPIAAATAAQEMVVSNGFTPSERLITAAVSKSKRPLQLIDALIERGIAVSARPFNTLMSFATDPRGKKQKTSFPFPSQRRFLLLDNGTNSKLAMFLFACQMSKKLWPNWTVERSTVTAARTESSSMPTFVKVISIVYSR